MNKSTSPRDTAFRRILEGYIAVSGMTKEQIAGNLGITKRCLSNWLNCPGMFRFTELRRICDMLRISAEDRKKIFEC